MKDDKKVPQLRFPEFTDAWKQRKFGDVLVSIQTGTNKLGSDRNSGQPLLKMGNLQSGYFDLSKLEFLENKAEPENIVKQGDFFFNTRNTLELVGKGATWFGESNKYAFNSNIARFTLKDVNTGFFNYLYNTNYVKKQIRARAMGTTSVAAIYPRSLKSVDIVIPNMEEQIKLSNLFMNLDSTITLQQRKLNSLQKLKKGLLQKMFPKNGENIPEIRFPEFSDAWKQRELGEIAERVTRRNSSLESQTPLTISAEYGLIDQNKFFGKRIAAKDLSNYYLIQKGEFAYNKSTSNDAPWGAIKRLDCYNNGALSTLYIVFKIKDNKSCYSDFLVTYYGTSLWHKGVKEIASEGARNHGLLNVSPSDFFRTKLVIPQDFEEQRKIGAFFTQLDNTITLQQRKLESLQKLKKGLLQQMFI